MSAFIASETRDDRRRESRQGPLETVAICGTEREADRVVGNLRGKGHRVRRFKRCIRAGGARAWVFVIVKRAAAS